MPSLSPLEALHESRRAALDLAAKSGQEKTRKLLERTAKELEARLKTIRTVGAGPQSFSHAQAQAALEHVKAVLVPLTKSMQGVLVEQADAAADKATEHAVAYLKSADRKFRGVAQQPLALREAAMLDRAHQGARASVLRRIARGGEVDAAEEESEARPAKQGILQRYGVETIGHFEEELQVGLIGRKPWDQVRDSLVEKSPFLQRAPAHWAERIVRSETMGSFNRASWEASREANEQLGDVVKILAATFDARTGWDSYQVHGMIRRVDEAFEWNGRKYMHPPNRPNDREIVVTHRLAWPLPDYLKPKTDGEVRARYRALGNKGSPPPRAKMSTVPLADFGKAPKATPEETATRVAVEERPPEQAPVQAPTRTRARTFQVQEVYPDGSIVDRSSHMRAELAIREAERHRDLLERMVARDPTGAIRGYQITAQNTRAVDLNNGAELANFPVRYPAGYQAEPAAPPAEAPPPAPLPIETPAAPPPVLTTEAAPPVAPIAPGSLTTGRVEETLRPGGFHVEARRYEETDWTRRGSYDTAERAREEMRSMQRGIEGRRAAGNAAAAIEMLRIVTDAGLLIDSVTLRPPDAYILERQTRIGGAWEEFDRFASLTAAEHGLDRFMEAITHAQSKTYSGVRVRRDSDGTEFRNTIIQEPDEPAYFIDRRERRSQTWGPIDRQTNETKAREVATSEYQRLKGAQPGSNEEEEIQNYDRVRVRREADGSVVWESDTLAATIVAAIEQITPARVLAILRDRGKPTNADTIAIAFDGNVDRKDEVRRTLEALQAKGKVEHIDVFDDWQLMPEGAVAVPFIVERFSRTNGWQDFASYGLESEARTAAEKEYHRILRAHAGGVELNAETRELRGFARVRVTHADHEIWERGGSREDTINPPVIFAGDVVDYLRRHAPRREKFGARATAREIAGYFAAPLRMTRIAAQEARDEGLIREDDDAYVLDYSGDSDREQPPSALDRVSQLEEVRSPIPGYKVRKHGLAQGLYDYDAAEQKAVDAWDHQDVKTETVAISAIHIRSQFVNEEPLRNAIMSPSPVQLVLANGRYYAHTDNEVIGAYLRGETSVTAHVLDLKAAARRIREREEAERLEKERREAERAARAAAAPKTGGGAIPVHLVDPDDFARSADKSVAMSVTSRALRAVFPKGVPSIETLQSTWGNEKAGYTLKMTRVEETGSHRSERVAFRGDIHNADGDAIGDYVRTFIRREDGVLEVHHDWFVVKKTDEQKKKGDEKRLKDKADQDAGIPPKKAKVGHGLGEVMMRQAIQLYEQIGVDEITVDAAWVGQYTWASFGYNWEDDEVQHREERLRHYLARKGMPKSKAREVAAQVASNACDVATLDVGIYTEATFNPGPRESETTEYNLPVGKAFMLEHGMWSGTLRLDDKSHPTYQRAKERLGL